MTASAFQFQSAIERALVHASGVELTSPAQISGLNGLRIGRRTGNALEFSEYREYRPGDDLRRIDWRVYARNEQLMIKQYSEEVDPRCDVIIDHSASMGLTERKTSAAVSLAVLFARAAVNAGFSLNVWYSGDSFRKELSPAAPLEWAWPEFDAPYSPSANVPALIGPFFHRGIRILISDLMGPDDPAPLLSRLSDGARRTIVVMVLDREELEPEAVSNILLRDVETGEERELAVDESVLNRYRERLERHRAMWARTALSRGVLLLPMETDRMYPEIHLDELFHAGLLK